MLLVVVVLGLRASGERGGKEGLVEIDEPGGIDGGDCTVESLDEGTEGRRGSGLHGPGLGAGGS